MRGTTKRFAGSGVAIIAEGKGAAVEAHHWEQYYRTGALVTGPAGDGGGYDLELRQAWAEIFADLPEGAGILDVGTGNGAVPLIAREVAQTVGRGWRIVGVDLARIDPRAHVPEGESRLAGIDFYGGVAAEVLPFDAASFDLVCGHYALEYTDRARSVPELRRVARAGARCRFILHHADSVLLHNARLSLAQAQFVLVDNKVYRRLRRVVSMVNEPEAAVVKAAGELRESIASLKQATAVAQGLSSSLILDASLDAVQQLLRTRTSGTPAQAEREVDRVENELRASVHRLRDLINHALDADAAQDLVRLFEASGWQDVSLRPQTHAAQHLVGWCLDAQAAH